MDNIVNKLKINISEILQIDKSDAVIIAYAKDIIHDEILRIFNNTDCK